MCQNMYLTNVLYSEEKTVPHSVAMIMVVMSLHALMVAASHSAIINLGLWGSDIVCAHYN